MKRVTSIHVLGCLCIVIALLCIGSSAIAQDDILSIEGQCPGEVTVRITAGQPERRYFLAFGLRRGQTVIFPPRPCAGTVLGITGRVRPLREAIVTDQNGNGSVSGQSGPAACGHFLQGLADGVCEPTNVVQIP